MPATLLTVGHGRLAAEELAQLLGDAGVQLLVDVRRYPGSRRHPQFRRAAMADWLADAGVAYRWEEDLGGRRPVPDDAPDVALPDSLRGYAAHLRGPAFGAAFARVLADAARRTVAVCCAEADWRRCHRRLLADAAVLLRGARVRHLLHDGTLEAHVPTPSARRDGERLVYDRGAERRLPGV